MDSEEEEALSIIIISDVISDCMVTLSRGEGTSRHCLVLAVNMATHLAVCPCVRVCVCVWCACVCVWRCGGDSLLQTRPCLTRPNMTLVHVSHFVGASNVRTISSCTLPPLWEEVYRGWVWSSMFYPSL